MMMELRVTLRRAAARSRSPGSDICVRTKKTPIADAPTKRQQDAQPAHAPAVPPRRRESLPAPAPARSTQRERAGLLPGRGNSHVRKRHSPGTSGQSVVISGRPQARALPPRAQEWAKMSSSSQPSRSSSARTGRKRKQDSRQFEPLLALQPRFQRILDGVQMEHVGGRIFELRLRQLRRRPNRTICCCLEISRPSTSRARSFRPCRSV